MKTLRFPKFGMISKIPLFIDFVFYIYPMEFLQKKQSILLIIIFTLFLWALYRADSMRKEIEDLKKSQVQSKRREDSLENEIFIKDVQLFRYERAVEIFEERNPSATSELNDIISDETE